MQTRPSLFGNLGTRLTNRLRASRTAEKRMRLGSVVPEIAVDARSLPYFRRELFPDAGPIPWLDRPDALESIERKVRVGRLSDAEAGLARSWVENGYVILPGFFSGARIAALWSEYEQAIATGTVVPPAAPAGDAHVGRVLNPHFKVPAVDAMLRDRAILEVIGMIMGVEPLPFQTLLGHSGSEQAAHSDTIHMTTYPMGYLIASWTAMEDIDTQCGPLTYYPGSHRLPYLMSEDLGLPVHLDKQGPYYAHDYRVVYEPAIARLLGEREFEPAYFTPRAGDVLLWHANLLHGGAPRLERERSRKALVCHYFGKGCITYHDLSAQPSHLQNIAMASREPLAKTLLRMSKKIYGRDRLPGRTVQTRVSNLTSGDMKRTAILSAAGKSEQSRTVVTDEQ